MPEPAARFENLVASHLAKWVEYQVDTRGEVLELRYFRDVDGREVDFVVLHNHEPIALVECKQSDADVSGSLRYLKLRYPAAQAWQVSSTGTRDYVNRDGIRVANAAVLLRGLV